MDVSIQKEGGARAAQTVEIGSQGQQGEADLGSSQRPAVFLGHDMLNSPDVLKVCSFIARQQADNFKSIASVVESRRHSFVGRILNFIDGENVDLLRTPVCSYSKILQAREALVPEMTPSSLEETLRALFKTGLVEPVWAVDVSPIGTGWTSIEGVRITDRGLFDAVL